MTDYAKIIAKELGVQASYAENAIALLDEGNTVPFIARYRKEATGSMDDQLLRQLADRVDYLRGLDKRRSEISASIEEQGAMTDDLRKALNEAQTLAVLEDIYRPYKPKRKTRASVAKAKGLEPLAALLLVQDAKTDPAAEALRFVTDEVKSASDALAGARDIIAEMISDSP